MKQYVDSVFMGYDDTILLYSGDSREPVIPGTLGGKAVTTLGDGAFYSLPQPRRIRVPETVHTLGKEVFYACDNLEEVSLPGTIRSLGFRCFGLCNKLRRILFRDIPVTPDQLAALDSDSLPLQDGSRLCLHLPVLPCLKDLPQTFTNFAPAAQIPSAAPVLYRDSGEDTRSLHRLLPQLRRQGEESTECEDFLRLLRLAGFPDPGSSEDESDRLLRKHGPFKRFPTVLVATYRAGTDGVTLTLHAGSFFWQSDMPVVWENKTYHLYRRYYLSGDPRYPYTRRDTAVFREDRLETNRETIEHVLRKYLLTAFL